jgi:hypothetical protein
VRNQTYTSLMPSSTLWAEPVGERCWVRCGVGEVADYVNKNKHVTVTLWQVTLDETTTYDCRDAPIGDMTFQGLKTGSNNGLTRTLNWKQQQDLFHSFSLGKSPCFLITMGYWIGIVP